MANAVITMSGIIGVTLAVPVIAGMVPESKRGAGTWSALTRSEFAELQKATMTPVQMTFSMTTQDGYLPEQTMEDYVWGIRVSPARFIAARPDLFGPTGKAKVNYAVPDEIENIAFVIFSPICPHLGCRYVWDDGQNRFWCHCHGSQYNFMGAHIAGPAPRGLDPLPLRERSGVAEIMWIRYETTTPDRIVVSYQA